MLPQRITVRHDAIHIALHAYEERFKTSHVPLSRECAVVLRVAASRPDFTVSASHVAWGVETSLGLASVVQQCRQDADDTSLWHVDGLPQEAARLLEEWREVKLTIEPVVELVMTHLSSCDNYSGCRVVDTRVESLPLDYQFHVVVVDVVGQAGDITPDVVLNRLNEEAGGACLEAAQLVLHDEGFMICIDPSIDAQVQWMRRLQGTTIAGPTTLDLACDTESHRVELRLQIFLKRAEHVSLRATVPSFFDGSASDYIACVQRALEAKLGRAYSAAILRFVKTTANSAAHVLLEVPIDDATVLLGAANEAAKDDGAVVLFDEAFKGRDPRRGNEPGGPMHRPRWRLQRGSPILNCALEGDTQQNPAFSAWIPLCESTRGLTPATIEYLCRAHARVDVRVDSRGLTRYIRARPEEETPVWALTERIRLSPSLDGVIPLSFLE